MLVQEEEEYWTVLSWLRAPSQCAGYDAPIEDAYLASLHRVQNPSLYTFFRFHHQRLEMAAADSSILERDPESGTCTRHFNLLAIRNRLRFLQHQSFEVEFV